MNSLEKWAENGSFFMKTLDKQPYFWYNIRKERETALLIVCNVYDNESLCPGQHLGLRLRIPLFRLVFLVPDRFGRKPMSIVSETEKIALPIAEQLGLTVWDIEFKKEGPDYVLRVYIDKEGGVGIDDCEAMSRRLDPILDEKDFIDRSYLLEVSSAGLIRELKTDEHCRRFVGHNVTVKLFRPVAGTKSLYGRLVSFDGDGFVIEVEGEEKKILRSDVSKMTVDLI